MIRQSAFTNNRKLLKGELHCHTTRSDGQGDPADVIRMYKEHGFDFLALTDHRRYNYENFAPETEITIIPGMEMDRNLPGPGVHCHHIVCVGPQKDQGNGFEQDQYFDSARIETADECQEMLDWIRKAEADEIRQKNVLNTPGPMADYYREHYPESWAIVQKEQKRL